MGNPFSRFELTYNPFELAASGIPVSGALWVPERWRHPLQNFLNTMQHTSGPKAFAILGEYGSGKTYLLRWLEREEFPKRRIRPFYFDNPGAQFYDLANSLLRQIGREEFAKALWEFLNPQLPGFQLPYRNMFSRPLVAPETRTLHSRKGVVRAQISQKSIFCNLRWQ